MQDEQPKKKPMSEIGHLFLSSVRDRSLGGMPLPQRTPPGGTPKPAGADEAFDDDEEVEAVVTAPARRTPPVTAILAEHLNGKQLARVKDYARHLAAGDPGQRIGLIALDASEFRLMCFEPGGGEASTAVPPAADAPTDCCDGRAMAEAIEEMNFDVDRWLLLIPSPRVPEAQPLLKLVDHWVLLSTCDHDGIVASYRMLKGLADLHRPRLSLAVLDSTDASQADKVHKKLAGVCQQFLDRSLEAEPPVRKAQGVCEHAVMLCEGTRDKAQLANPPQWNVVREFLVRTTAGSVADVAVQQDEAQVTKVEGGIGRQLVGEVVVPMQTNEPVEQSFAMTPQAQANQVQPTPVPIPSELPEVLDLPSADASPEQIVSAVLKQVGCTMLECPVRPPMCAEARLAVTRDRGMVLVAVAKRGLAELSTIGQAYRWLIENRSLIGMAVPQLAIDPAQPPRLRLLVDQCDAGAQVLRPMLSGDHVAVQSYRRVQWAGRPGLLLDAA